MNVLHVTAGKLFGGVEVGLNTLAHESAHYPDYRPQFALCFEARLAHDLVAIGVPVCILGSVQVRFPWQVWRARSRLKALLRRDHPDIVICHAPWTFAIFGPTIRRASAPLVLWMHDAAVHRHWVERWASRCTPDLVVCNSQYTAGSLPGLFGDSDLPTKIVHYPVVNTTTARAEPAQKATLRAKFDTPPHTCVIVQVGRMERYKGHEQHLDALGLLADVPDWICWIVGGAQRPCEETYLRGLKERAARLGIADRVRFLGERRDVNRLLGAADIFCQPNLEPEPFGLVYIEALYAGLPAVGTAFGGALEIIDEHCGRLVPPYSPKRLAETLQELIASPDLRAALGRAGPAKAEKLCEPNASIHALLNCLDYARGHHQGIS